MNEFTKKYNQLAKQYNFKQAEIIQENILDDAKNKAKAGIKKIKDTTSNIWSIIKKGPEALLNLIKSWFNKEDESNMKSYAEKATKIINMGSSEKIISEGIGDWFSSLCGQVKNGFKLITSDKSKQQFLAFLQQDKKLSNDKLKNLSFLDTKQYLTEYTEKQLKTNNIIKEEIIDQEILTTTIGVTVCFLIVLIAIPIFCGWLKEQRRDKTQGEKNAIDAERNAAAKERQNKANEKIDRLTKEALISAYKDCGALK